MILRTSCGLLSLSFGLLGSLTGHGCLAQDAAEPVERRVNDFPFPPDAVELCLARRDVALVLYREALLGDLAELGVEVTGNPELARYNSPFTPWFLRRNEIIVPVDWSPTDTSPAVASETPARL